jgi:hypothetical protein
VHPAQNLIEQKQHIPAVKVKKEIENKKQVIDVQEEKLPSFAMHQEFNEQNNIKQMDVADKEQDYNEEEFNGSNGNCYFNVGICPVNGGLLDVVDMTDRKLVCSKCALFGNIRNHTFRELNEISRLMFDRAEM